MAGNEEQGTGKHKHKSAEEPYSHHEAPTTRGEGRGREESETNRSHESRSESRGNESRSESRGSHSESGSHSGEGRSGSGSHSGGREDSRGESRGQGSNESSDLKSREYRGPDGEIHHHTRTYEEQHRGKK